MSPARQLDVIAKRAHVVDSDTWKERVLRGAVTDLATLLLAIAAQSVSAVFVCPRGVHLLETR